MSARTITPPESAPVSEVARWLGLDYVWLWRLVCSGVIPGRNQGSRARARWWVRPADVLAYLDERPS